jgi:hypothetical protein
MNDKFADERSIGNGLVGIYHSFIETIARKLSGGTEEKHEYLIRVVSVTTDIGIEYFLSKDLEHCNCVNSIDQEGHYCTLTKRRQGIQQGHP